jgi:uncharacterized HhH-GPD family protein
MADWLPSGKLPDASTKRGSFLFLVGIILNQNISGEQAWRGVGRLSERTDVRPERLAERTPEELRDILRTAPVIHPFVGAMAHAIAGAAGHVCDHYEGDARQLWREACDHQDVISRMTDFRQIGRHKAEVAVFLLTTVYGELGGNPPQGVEASCPALLSYLS